MEETRQDKKKKQTARSWTHRDNIIIPRRVPSTITPARKPIFITPDKTTCAECGCFPKEDPYVRKKKLNPCLKSPLTLCEIAAAIVDSMPYPKAFTWSVADVGEWMAEEVGLPQYRESILQNQINGLRLLMLEDPSKLPQMNIHDFHHILRIIYKVRQEFGTEFVKFSRSVGLPTRQPLTHCTWFKSRTGPSWGIRKNWTRSNILRWMKILMPEPLHLDHWDLVWYRPPDFPKVKFARLRKPRSEIHIPHYNPRKEKCNEYLVPRKFRLQTGISESKQMIWMEHRPPLEYKPEKKKEVTIMPPKVCTSRLTPKTINLTGLRGKDLILARRKMPRPKFLP